MRATHTADLLSKMIPAIGERIDIWYTARGSIALVHAEDGNAYEVEIRPASLSQFEPFDKYTKKKKKPMKESAMRDEDLINDFADEVEEFLLEDFDYEDLYANLKDDPSGFAEWITDSVMTKMEEKYGLDFSEEDQFEYEEVALNIVKKMARRKHIPPGRIAQNRR